MANGEGEINTGGRLHLQLDIVGDGGLEAGHCDLKLVDTRFCAGKL